MKGVCILLMCMAAVAFAYFDEDEEEFVEKRREKAGTVKEKMLAGKYLFRTTAKGNGKYKCECFKGNKRIWAGMCGVRDKKFQYNDCD